MALSERYVVSKALFDVDCFLFYFNRSISLILLILLILFLKIIIIIIFETASRFAHSSMPIDTRISI